MITRRNLLLGAASAGVLAGCGRLAPQLESRRLPDLIAPPSGNVAPVVRLLDRAGWGPRPGEVEEVEALGPEVWLERQLQPEEAEPARLTFLLNRLDILRVDGMELRDLPENEMVRQLQAAALLRAVYSPWSLRERMVDFWSNHFNIYARKGFASYRKPADDVNVVRAHALGKFRDMLMASAKSPAMLGYLDNRLNMKTSPNENYAREIMELHTLGVDGGYTQRDVQEVARCFTGWRIENRFLKRHGAFRFDPERHDDGEKVVLGHRIPAGGGIKDGEQVVEILAKHPSTARHLSRKLCRHFLGTDDTPWVARLAEIYTRTEGDIPSLLRPLLLSEEVREGPPVAKRPVDFVVSALRAVDADTEALNPVQAHLEAMGQPLFEWPMPDGYPDGAAPWAGSLLARWNFAFALAEGRLGDTRVRVKDLTSRMSPQGPEGWANLVLPGRTVPPIPNETDPMMMALALASPEFQWR